MDVLKRLDALEDKVELLLDKVTANIRFASIEADLGTLIAENELLKTKLETVQLPSDVTFFLSSGEVNFLRDGIAQVSQLLSEMRALRDEIVRERIARG